MLLQKYVDLFVLHFDNSALPSSTMAASNNDRFQLWMLLCRLAALTTNNQKSNPGDGNKDWFECVNDEDASCSGMGSGRRVCWVVLCFRCRFQTNDKCNEDASPEFSTRDLIEVFGAQKPCCCYSRRLLSILQNQNHKFTHQRSSTLHR